MEAGRVPRPVLIGMAGLRVQRKTGSESLAPSTVTEKDKDFAMFAHPLCQASLKLMLQQAEQQ